MKVSAWKSSYTYGILIGKRNRQQYFSPTCQTVELELDGHLYKFSLTQSFWEDCPEIRDSGKPLIREWLKRHKSVRWPLGKTPKMELIPIAGPIFRLVP